MKRTLRGHLRVWSAAGLFLTGAACAVNPVTGRPQLALITEGQEVQIGQQAAQDVERSIGMVPDEALQRYVNDLGVRMAAVSERPHLPWRFGVVDDPTPNAFALPGGFIYFTRGMMALFESEAEMATVLGHEIGHVTARHHVAMISRAQLAQIGLGVGGVVFPQLEGVLGGLASGGLQILFLRYSRDAERQADELGFNYSLALGYDVRTMSNVFYTLHRMGEAAGASPLPNWLSTHPAPADRIAAVEQRLAEIELPPSPRRGRVDYLQRLEGLVYGVNPRNGFFRDGVFLHPDLEFRMNFPTGWRTQNLAQSVTAGSPQQDAIIQLTLAQDLNAGTAAQRFLAQGGVRAGQGSRQTINGLPAVVSYFQAQTEQGVLGGYGGWIEHGGRVYQVIGFTPSQRFGQYERLFQQVVGSFGRLTDPEVLGVQPERIRIATLPRAMTFAQFYQEFPSSIPLEELAIINQIRDVNATIPSGQILKRVVP